MSTATKKKRPTDLDKIVIRRPVPSPEALQDMEPAAQPPTAVNPEFEEKPPAELDMRTSEDFHGGAEQTFSMPSPQGGGAQQQEGGGAQQQASAGQASQSAFRQQGAGPKDAGLGGAQQQGGIGEMQQREESSNGAGQQSSGEGAASARQLRGQQSFSQQKSGDARPAEGGGESAPASQAQQSVKDAGQQAAETRRGSEAEERGGAEQKPGSREAGGSAQQQGGGGQQHAASQQQNATLQQQQAESQQQDVQQYVDLWKQYYASRLGRDVKERGDVRELGRSVKTGGGGSHMGVGGYNTAQVVDVEMKTPQRPGLRRLQTEFYRVLEMLAEEKTKYFDPSLVGGLVKAEYNVKKMALRRYEGKPPTRYKAPRVREAVVLVLDNSGSMASWAEMLRVMAELAAKRRDVEVYLAPNGYVEEQIAPVSRKVNHDDFMKKMSGRKIIYVGDFDGANTPVELSWRNEVIWIAPESRYRRFLSHSWVKYDESKYKGAFIRTFTIDDTMKALKKVLGGAKWIDTCVKCEDD